MAKPVASLPLAFRISSSPTKISLSLFAARHLFIAPNCSLNRSTLTTRSYSSSISKGTDETTGKRLPWLSASMERERRKLVKNETSKGVKSSWEESAEKFLKGGGGAGAGAGGGSTVETREPPLYDSRKNGFRNPVNEDEGEREVSNDPRWYNIRKRYDEFSEVKPGSDRPDVRRWNKQEDWGRKTWKEAKESTLPKIAGEGIYGVGPVLAALSAGRRECYALYVQDGLDLSSNNKKKDKKGFERVLKMADKIGLSKIEVSKHDLNMIVDNRPHQGLVLDASPLEMVGIKELDPVSITQGERAPLWLALDEVTDPQNLGAIIRSAYFFGASGVVLCAKNSAPLSGVVSKASAGSLELVELRSCKNMMKFLESSAGNGWRVLGGSVSQRAVPLSDVVPGAAPTVLVLGSEGTGLRPLVERSCTQLIKIHGQQPIDLVLTNDDDDDVDKVENRGREVRSFLAVDSLNVSVAAGVMLNHLVGSSCDDSGYAGESQQAA